MKLACKVGVLPHNLWIAAAITRISLPVDEVTITAGIDGKHMTGSKHYLGNALDIRTKNFPPKTKEVFATALQVELGPDYQVIFEAAGTPNEHLHVEYDPPKRKHS